MTSCVTKHQHLKKWSLALILPWFLFSCDNSTQQTVTSADKELLVYCGITMIQPMQEIASIIGKEQNAEIKITKGGSGNLLKSIKTNQVGDLFLPGSDSYIKAASEEGLIQTSALVGYNQAAIMVQKGNPKQINSDINNLIRDDLSVVLGSPESGSIGRETKNILTKAGIYDKAMTNTVSLTTDSKDLTKAIKEEKADLVINWYATSFWEENEPFMDALKIDETYAEKKKLVLGLLKFSKHPDVAQRFIDYAISPEGQAIFKKYGFL